MRAFISGRSGLHVAQQNLADIFLAVPLVGRRERYEPTQKHRNLTGAKMKFTALIPGAAPDAIDSTILTKLDAEATDLRTVHRQNMKIGIRNQDGAIYRVIGTTGLDYFMEVIFELQRLKLVDELEIESGMREGCDAIFRVR
jgi:hypothetical protein